MASVGAVAALSARGAPSVEAYRAALEARLGAMARTQDLLAGNPLAGAPLRALLEAELAPYESAPYGGAGGRVALAGPAAGAEPSLNPRAALAMGLVLHELATNAAKHGALAGEAGALRVAWRWGAGGLALDWRERRGPGAAPLAPPALAPAGPGGFGRRLIARCVEGDLAGRASASLAPEGLRLRLRAPRAALLG